MDAGLGIAISGGSISIATIVVSVVVWSLKRNVQHEDDSKKNTHERLEKTEARIAAVEKRLDQSFAQLEKRISDVAHQNELDARDTAQKVSNLTSSIGTLQGLVSGLSTSVETSRDKMSTFYKVELDKLEQSFRQELSKSLHPDLPERMTRLEAAVGTRRRGAKR